MTNYDRTPAELLRDVAKLKKQELTPEQFEIWFDGLGFALNLAFHNPKLFRPSLKNNDFWNEQEKIQKELEEA